MGVYLNPGNDGFYRSLRSEIYVDKTGLIDYTNRVFDTNQMYVCASRPRRFGKTMTAEMLAAYYCKTCCSRELFQNLDIGGMASFEKYLNQYNVIFVNMQHILSSAETAESILDYLQQEIIEELREVYSEYIDTQEMKLPSALTELYAKTKQGFVFIIDEWDCIFREKQQNQDLQIAYLDFLRNLLENRNYVKLAYMTGILPIKKYGTHSALEMFSEFSMTDAGMVAKYVGFTEDEVTALCQRYNMDLQEVYHWYGGYQLENNLHIFNPKSVVECMLRRRIGNYWTNTETYEALKAYIDMNYDGLKDSIVELLGGKFCKVNTRTFVNDMITFNHKDDVLTLLVHLGYLAFNKQSKEVYIPNKEIHEEFLAIM